MKKDKLKVSGMHDGATPSVFKNAKNCVTIRLKQNKKSGNFLR
jgi:hypothetical protein|nr:hypothetical protein [Nonlabens sp. Ci31]